MANELFEDFRRCVEGPDDRIDLARAALEIARDDYPNLKIEAYLSCLDQLAASARRHFENDQEVHRKMAALNYVLFQEQGFHGNQENYYDPKNSFLNEVIDRKTGIPITLSVIYMEVAQRIGLPLLGVGFPGHFLVKYSSHDEEIVIDPFNSGEIKSHENLGQLLDRLYEEKVILRPEHLATVTKKDIIRRMLNNLKMIYLRESNFAKALPVLERLVILDPGAVEEIRDRGAVYLKLECFNYALADFETYLRLAPDAPDAGAIKDEVISLTRRVRQIH